MVFYRAAWMSVTFMVGCLGVAVALLSDHAKVNSAVAAVVGIATGTIAYITQEARCVTDYRRQALTQRLTQPRSTPLGPDQNKA